MPNKRCGIYRCFPYLYSKKIQGILDKSGICPFHSFIVRERTYSPSHVRLAAMHSLVCGRQLRTSGLMRRTVSILCPMMSGRVFMTCANNSSLPRKSGTSTSMVVCGLRSRMAFTVCTQCAAPKSGKSSRSTDVMTACDNFIKAMDSATWAGSSGSRGAGLPVCVLQNLQLRVQMFPPIKKVAVPLPQHSPRFGHRPLLQMVCRRCESTMRFVSA